MKVDDCQSPHDRHDIESRYLARMDESFDKIQFEYDLCSATEHAANNFLEMTGLDDASNITGSGATTFTAM
jgi:hypothetical protein